MKIVLSEKYQIKKSKLLEMVNNFEEQGDLLTNGKRNKIKVFDLGEVKINIKSFKIPNHINKIAYSFLRKSKAERSFLYAQILLSRGILTPQPVGFMEQKHRGLINNSFYASENLNYDFSFREVNEQDDFPNREAALRAFTRFTYNLHENGVNFLDHSPGNTLIIQKENDYDFYLIDLNRMKFHKMNMEDRLKNFSRLTTKPEVMKIIAREYSILSDKPEEEIFQNILFFTNQFHEKRNKKRAVKRKFRSLFSN